MGMFYSQDSLADVARLVPWHRTQEAMCKAWKPHEQRIWTKHLDKVSEDFVWWSGWFALKLASHFFRLCCQASLFSRGFFSISQPCWTVHVNLWLWVKHGLVHICYTHGLVIVGSNSSSWRPWGTQPVFVGPVVSQSGFILVTTSVSCNKHRVGHAKLPSFLPTGSHIGIQSEDSVF